MGKHDQNALGFHQAQKIHGIPRNYSLKTNADIPLFLPDPFTKLPVAFLSPQTLRPTADSEAQRAVEAEATSHVAELQQVGRKEPPLESQNLSF